MGGSSANSYVQIHKKKNQKTIFLQLVYVLCGLVIMTSLVDYGEKIKAMLYSESTKPFKYEKYSVEIPFASFLFSNW